MRLSASLSPPRAATKEGKHGRTHSNKRGKSVGEPRVYLSRASPFGSLSQMSARRTFAYLLATLNATHTDYDFTYIMRPFDFHRERSLERIKQTVDGTLMPLRPRTHTMGGGFLAPTSRSRYAVKVPEFWSPIMWDVIDRQMHLDQCEAYSYDPSPDPLAEDEGCIWSMHYFFFNKHSRRVCYLHLRGLSTISHSPVHVPTHLESGAGKLRKASGINAVGDGAGKRAGYWLGSATGALDTSGYDEDDDDEMVDDDEVDEVPGMDLDDIRSGIAQGWAYNDVYDDDEYDGWDGAEMVF